jgi:hypothetical protein
MARSKATTLGGPVGAFVLNWVEALATDVSAAPSGLEQVIAQADHYGYRNYGEMARVDLALALARASQDASAALADVRAMHDEMGMVPLLGPLPETQWIDQRPA